MSEQVVLSKSEQKHLNILAAAIQLFCEHGFPHTSMEEVAKQAGVSKQTVYSHFGSKDDLFIAAIKSRCLVHQMSDSILSDPKDPQRCILEFAIKFGEMIVSHEAITVYRACIAQSESHPELSKMFYEAGPVHIFNMLEQYFQAVEAEGEYAFGNCKDSAIRLCSMLFGELKIKRELGLDTDGLAQTRQQFIQQSAALFLKAHRV